MRKKYYWFLWQLAVLFDQPGIRLLNRPVRWVLARVFRPVLEGALRQRFRLSREFRLVSRHSVNSPRDYNIFLSDLDMTVVLPGRELHKADEITAFILRLRRVFIFLGEIETSSIEEMAAIKTVLGGIVVQYQYLRDLRKITWIENDQTRFRTMYHRLKSERCLRKLLRQNEVPGPVLKANNISLCRDSAHGFLKQIGATVDVPEMEFSVFCRYLNFSVSQGAFGLESTGAGMLLPHPYGVLFLATVPFETDIPDLKKAIANLRRQESVCRLWEPLLRAEIHIMGGVYRGRTDLFPWIPPWRSELQSWLPAPN